MSRAQAEELLTPVDLVRAAAFHFTPGDAPDGPVSSYVTILRDALDGRTFTAERGRRLVQQAIEFGLSAGQVRDVHHDMLCEMFDVALADNRVSPSERRLLDTMATWLGVRIDDFDAWVKAGRVRRKEAQRRFKERVSGQLIVITGKGVHPNNIREALALKHGFTISSTFKKSAHLVVAGSEIINTAAVAEAQAAGIEIMTETTFWRNLGEL